MLGEQKAYLSSPPPPKQIGYLKGAKGGGRIALRVFARPSLDITTNDRRLIADIATSALSASEDSQIRQAVRFSAHGSDSFCNRLA